MCHQKTLKFQYCLVAPPVENKINHLEKKKTDVDSLKEGQKEFIKNNKLLLKMQQKFRSEKHYVFTKEINKIALKWIDDKEM